jgi:hypothetical protein
MTRYAGEPPAIGLRVSHHALPPWVKEKGPAHFWTGPDTSNLQVSKSQDYASVMPPP